MSMENLVSHMAELAARLEEDILTAPTRQDSIRLTARAVEAREAERLARKELARRITAAPFRIDPDNPGYPTGETIGETVNMLRDEGLPY